jgi:hypothetical protein
VVDPADAAAAAAAVEGGRVVGRVAPGAGVRRA